MNVLSLFDGMSCGQIALDKLGIKVDNYFASEIEKDSIKVTQSNYPNTKQIGSVTDVKGIDLPNIDLLIGGSPCQGFSVAGKRKGSTTKEGIDVTNLEQYLELKELGFEFDGQSFLFWEYVRLLKETKPKYFLLENVRVSKKWLPMFNETMGVEGVLINSNLVSAHNRPRMYWTNIPNFEIPTDKGITFDSVMDNIEMTKPLSPYMTANFNGVNRLDKGIFTFTKSKKACCLTKGAGHGNKVLIDREKGLQRRLTRNELERLQTVPENYTKEVRETKAGEMLGNGWTVDVIAHIFKNIPQI
jgi:DNA (cytosine-5)-methyltransferase 3A|tara:strand:+ start:142 stop:1044 length:903 start_codon:yes stop_codon:yes gene_type:complete